MKTINIVPKSQGARDKIKEHGEIMEVLLDNSDKILVRSLEDTYKFREDIFGNWIGSFIKEKVDLEEVLQTYK